MFTNGEEHNQGSRYRCQRDMLPSDDVANHFSSTIITIYHTWTQHSRSSVRKNAKS